MTHIVNFTAERVLLTEDQQDYLELPHPNIPFETVTNGLKSVIDAQRACHDQMWRTEPAATLREKYRLGEKMMEYWEKEEMLGALAGDIIEFEFKNLLAKKTAEAEAAETKKTEQEQRGYPFSGGWIDDDEIPFGD